MLGPLASARRDFELHSGGRPDAAAAAERFAPWPTARSGDEARSAEVIKIQPAATAAA
jgi:hypothetical protein